MQVLEGWRRRNCVLLLAVADCCIALDKFLIMLEGISSVRRHSLLASAELSISNGSKG